MPLVGSFRPFTLTATVPIVLVACWIHLPLSSVAWAMRPRDDAQDSSFGEANRNGAP